MSLRDEIAATAVRPGPKCQLEEVLAAHPDEADEIRSLIKDHKVSATAIAKVTNQHGIKVPEWSIKRHRNNLCVTCQDKGVKW